MHEKLKWFPFYPLDWMTDEAVMGMSFEARGVYLSLLLHQWLHGGVPSDFDSLSSILGNMNRRSLTKVWPQVAVCFTVHPEDPDRLINPRLKSVYDEQVVKHQRRQSAGRLGGIAKATPKHSPSIAPSNATTRASTSPSTPPHPTPPEGEDGPKREPNGSPVGACLDIYRDEIGQDFPLSPGELGKYLKPLVKSHGLALVELWWRRAVIDVVFVNHGSIKPAYFVRDLARWQDDRRFNEGGGELIGVQYV